MKINVIGTSGSGKTTLARKMAERLQLPYVEMDALFWGKNWTEKADSEFIAGLEKALAQPGWVLDGNYNRTKGLKWQHVDYVVWLDYPFRVTLWQAISRAWLRSWDQQELWAGTGNRESLRNSFFSRQSIILWTIKTYYHHRRRYLTDMQDARYQHIRFIRLRSHRQSEQFIERLAAQYGACQAAGDNAPHPPADIQAGQ